MFRPYAAILRWYDWGTYFTATMLIHPLFSISSSYVFPSCIEATVSALCNMYQSIDDSMLVFLVMAFICLDVVFLYLHVQEHWKFSWSLLCTLVWFTDTYRNNQDLNFNEITRQTELLLCLRDCIHCNYVVNMQTTHYSQRNLTMLIHVKHTALK
jgi:hypothetical protein